MEFEKLVERVTQEIAAMIARGEASKIVVCADNQCLVCDTSGHCAAVHPSKVHSILDAGADRIGSSVGLGEINPDLAGLIDHTLLKPDATSDQVKYLCAEAVKHRFISVCVNPFWVSYCDRLLHGHPVKVCCVVGFPLGADNPAVKGYETRVAIEEGADEIDMVINIGALKSKLYDVVKGDICGVVESAGRGTLVKVILETALLTDEEKIKACELAKAAGAHFVKTSTGFGPGGATAADVALMRRVVGPSMGVKASGGIRDYEKAQMMVESGATRIGASASVKIVERTPDLAQAEPPHARASAKAY